jgi:hypothetical protein
MFYRRKGRESSDEREASSYLGLGFGATHPLSVFRRQGEGGGEDQTLPSLLCISPCCPSHYAWHAS